MKESINQLIKELEGVTQESIDNNKRYFGTPEFIERVIWRLQDALKKK
jgi:hypothetical protein